MDQKKKGKKQSVKFSGTTEPTPSISVSVRCRSSDGPSAAGGSHFLPSDKVHCKWMQARASSVQHRRVGWEHRNLLMSPSKFSPAFTINIFPFSIFPSYVALSQSLLYSDLSGFHTEQWVSSAELHSPGVAGRRPPLPRFSSSDLASFKEQLHLRRLPIIFFVQKRMNPTFGLNLRSCRRGNSSFARTSDSLVRLKSLPKSHGLSH